MTDKPCKPLKIGVFYDGNFFLHTSNYYNYIHPKRSRLSISGLHSFVVKRLAELDGYPQKMYKISESHYFRGRINAAEAAQRGNQLYNDRVFEDILMAEGIQTHYLPLRNLSGRKEERGIDVWFSLEVYERALLEKIDIAVLIISDTDYVPLMRKLDSLGVKTVLLSWEFDYTNDDGARIVTKTSHELVQLACYPLIMQDEIEDGIENEDPIIDGLFVGCGESRMPEVNSIEDDLEAMNEDIATGNRDTGEILSIKSGFGFVKYPNNNLFFHYLDVMGDFSDLMPGDIVEFTVEQNQQGHNVAKRVCKVM